MKNRLLVLFASSILALPMLVQAVGMGSIKVYSHLNERLRAEIPILSVNSQNKGRVTVALGTNAEFAKRGVERLDILNDLSFAVLEKSNGRMYVEVTSNKQIVEPYLNFILTLNDGEGMVSREFAVFLDPAKPSFAGGSQSTPPKAVSKGTTTKSQATSSTTRKTTRKATPPATRWQVESQKGGTYGPVRKKETLWSIATHTRPSESIPVRDMVNLIMRANPSVFPSYQAQKMPSGVTLNIPKIQGFSAYAGGYAPMPGMAVAEKKTATAGTTSKDVAKRPAVNTTTEKQPATEAKPATDNQTASANTQTTADNETADSSANQTTTTSTDTTTQTDGDSGESIANTVANTLGTATEAVSESAAAGVDAVKEGASELAESASETANEVAANVSEAGSEMVEQAGAALDSAKDQLSMDIPSTNTEQEQALEAAKQEAQQAANNQNQAAQQQADTAATEAAAAAEEAKKKAAEARRKAALQPQPKTYETSFLEDNMMYLLGGGGAVAALLALLGFTALRRKKSNSEEKNIVLLDEDDLSDDEEEDELDEDLLADVDDDLVEETKTTAKSKSVAETSIDDELEEDLSDLEDLDDDFDLDLGSDDDMDDLDKLLGTVSDSSDSNESKADEDDEFGADLDKLLETKSEPEVKPVTTQVEEKSEEDDFSFDFSLDDEPEVSIVSPAKREDAVDLSDASDDLNFETQQEEVSEAVEEAKPAVEEADTAVQEDMTRRLSEEDFSRVQMKLDLANSFVSIAENKRAKDLIEEVIKEGNAEQVAEAKGLLEQLDS